MDTKKMLVAFQPGKNNNGTSDFLVPIVRDDTVSLFGLKSKKIHHYGRMVFIGKAINKNDIFARFVDSGAKIPSVADQVKLIEAFVEQVNTFKIGDVLELDAEPIGDAAFTLKKSNISSIQPNSKKLP